MKTALKPAIGAAIGSILFILLSFRALSQTTSEDIASSPSLARQAASSEDFQSLKELPTGVARALLQSNEQLEKSAAAAQVDLNLYLQNETNGLFEKSHDLLCKAVRERMLRNETSEAIVNQVRLYLRQPAHPNSNEADAIRRAAELVKAGKLNVRRDEPSLWVYQWVHETGSVEARFENTGPYTNEFKLKDYKIIDIHMASDTIAVGWVTEKIAVPVEIIEKRLAVYMLKKEDGRWRIYSMRGADGPRIYQWLGLKTTLWPDQLDYTVRNPASEPEQ